MNRVRQIPKIERVNYFISILAFCIMLFPILMASIYTRPHVDDFMVPALTFGKGFLPAMKYWYLNWTGRYFSIFLLSFANPLRYNIISIYPFVILATIILQLAVTYVWLKNLFIDVLSHSEIILNWVLLNSFFYAFIPGLSDGVYWMAGNYTYFISIILLPIWLWNLFSPNKFLRESFRISCILCIGIFLIGTNELSLLTVLVVIFSKLLAFLLSERRLKTGILLICITLLLFALLSILSPGNSMRSSQVINPNKGKLFHAIYSSCALGWMHMRFILFKTPLLFLTIIIPLKFYRKLITYFHFSAIKSHIFLIPLIAWSIYLSTFFPGSWIMLGNYSRTLNYSYFIFLISWLISIAVIVDISYLRYSGFLKEKIINKIRQPLILFYLLILFIVPCNNLKMVYQDIFNHTDRNYSIQLANRFKVLSLNMNQNTVFIDSLHFIPLSIFPYNMSGDNFKNIDSNYRIYYHIKKIIFK